MAGSTSIESLHDYRFIEEGGGESWNNHKAFNHQDHEEIVSIKHVFRVLYICIS
jgi:hypothetical protein